MYIILLSLLIISEFCHKSYEDQPKQVVKAQNEVLVGLDVSLHCNVSLLSESSTLLWEKDGEQISNTTLIYNSSAYIILHTVDERNTGQYYCRLIENGTVQTVRNHMLHVKTNSYTTKNKNHIIYRQSSSKGDVLLICKSAKHYKSWRLTLEQSPNSEIDLIRVETGGKVQVKGPINPGRLSSTTHNSQNFTFHISPVRFNYSGTYRCITERGTYTTTILHTIKVSVEHPHGVLRNQSVLLTCELSKVTESVTLVWLKMERNRGVLEKQIMTNNKKNNKLQLKVNLSSYKTDPLRWQCAVFTENELRALAPITISFTPTTTNAAIIRSTDTSTVTSQETQGSDLQMVIIVASAVTFSVLVLLSLLVLKCLRNTDAGPINGLRSQEEEDIHYASVTIAAYNQGADRCNTNHASSEMLDNDVVIYSAIKAH